MSKKKSYQVDSNLQSTLQPVEVDLNHIDTTELDTVYGITNEQAIPHRDIGKNFVPETETTENPVPVLFTPTKLKVEVYEWQTLLLLSGLFLVAFVKAFSNNRFKESFKALINYSVAQEIIREEKVFFHRANLFLTLNYLICGTLFILFLNTSYSFSIGKPTLTLFMIVLAFILLVYVIKFVFSRVLFFVFNDTNLSSEYIFNVSLYNNLLGVFLIPILGICYYSGLKIDFILTYIAFPLISICLILRILRQIVFGKSRGISYFYIFLYICTLEILPLVVLYRFFILK